MGIKGRVGASVIAMAAISTIASPVSAQTASGQSDAQPQANPSSSATIDQADDIVITARKRDERLRDIPMAASVVSAEDIDQRGGLQGVKDLVTAIPSVAFGDTSTPLTSEISIRGSGTSRGTSADSGVGLYRDGAFVGGGAQGGRTFSRFDLFDVSRIEVLRGTQGALYGRNAVGGAINVIAARPSQDRSGYMSLRGGTNDYIEFGGVVNQPLNDQLALRLSTNIMYQPKGAFYNPELGNYIDSQSTYGYRAQLQYKIDNFDANVMAETATNKYPALNLQYWVDPSATTPKGIYIEPKYTRYANFENLDTDRVNNIEFSSHYRFAFGTLTSITLWRDRKSLQQFDTDLLTPAFVAQITAAGLLAPGASLGEVNGTQQNRGRTKSFNQQLYIAGDIGQRLKWLVGGEYLRLDDSSNITATRTPTKASPSAGTNTISAQQLRSWAAYGSLEYDFKNGFDITGEVRYTSDNKSFQTNQFDLTTGLAVAGKLVNADFNPANTSWDVTASYKFARDWLGYVKAGTGFRAGGFNSNLGVPQQPIPIPVSYGNENTLSYEAGVKGNLARSLYITAAAYYTDVTNLIIQINNGCAPANPICPRAATPFATDGGEARIYGLETEATLRVPLAGGKFAGTIGGSIQEGKITSGVYNGDRPPQMPRYLTSANLNYSHPVGLGTTAFVNVVYRGRFGGVQEIAQTPLLQDYQLVNARLGVRTGPLELSVWANNVFNTTYLTFSGPSNRRWSQPRTYGVQLVGKW